MVITKHWNRTWYCIRMPVWNSGTKQLTNLSLFMLATTYVVYSVTCVTSFRELAAYDCQNAGELRNISPFCTTGTPASAHRRTPNARKLKDYHKMTPRSGHKGTRANLYKCAHAPGPCLVCMVLPNVRDRLSQVAWVKLRICGDGISVRKRGRLGRSRRSSMRTSPISRGGQFPETVSFVLWLELISRGRPQTTDHTGRHWWHTRQFVVSVNRFL